MSRRLSACAPRESYRSVDALRIDTTGGWGCTALGLLVRWLPKVPALLNYRGGRVLMVSVSASLKTAALLLKPWSCLTQRLSSSWRIDVNAPVTCGPSNVLSLLSGWHSYQMSCGDRMLAMLTRWRIDWRKDSRHTPRSTCLGLLRQTKCFP